MARPTAVTQEVLAKLIEAFKSGCTDAEACAHAGISESTLYEYQKKTPGFQEEKEAYKEMPAIAAKRLIANKVSTEVSTAQWYLERKKKDEFSTRSELTGKNGKDLPAPIIGGATKDVHDDDSN